MHCFYNKRALHPRLQCLSPLPHNTPPMHTLHRKYTVEVYWRSSRAQHPCHFHQICFMFLTLKEITSPGKPVAARCQRNARRSLAKPCHSGELKEMSPLAYSEETIVIPRGILLHSSRGRERGKQPRDQTSTQITCVLRGCSARRAGASLGDP